MNQHEAIDRQPTAPVTAVAANPARPRGARLGRLIQPLWLPLTLLVAAVALAAMYRPFALMEGGDNAIWDYVAQSILRGQVPYRDVIEIKTPGAAYLSAAAMAVGNWLGLDTVLAVRVLFVLLVGVLSVVIYLVGVAYLDNRLAAVIACLIPLLWPDLLVMMISGTRPKVPTIICGLLTLLFIAKDRPVWAGLCSMLAFVCWQPGLLFTGTAVLVFSRYLTRWRDGRALRVMAGALVPLAVLLGYFAARGALGDLWKWTITYNYAVYYPEGKGPAGAALDELWFLIKQVTGDEVVWVRLGIGGWVWLAAQRITARFRKSPPAGDEFKEALLVPPVIFLAFCIINYPGADGLIVLLPLAGVLAAYALAAIYQGLVSWRPVAERPALARFVAIMLIAPLAAVAYNAVKRAHGYQIEPGRTLADQRREFQKIADQLGPDDKIYVHGSLEILVLLNRPNLNPYIFLDRGKDRFLAARTAGGLDAVFAEMQREAPKIVALSRLQAVDCREALTAWAASHYERLPVGFAHNSVFIAKAAAPPSAAPEPGR